MRDSPRYRMLECSQVGSPDDFWRLYGGENRGFGMLWETLSGPRTPRRFIEVRNVERLVANGHREFVDNLEELSLRLDADKAGTTMLVVRFSSNDVARGRLYQHGKLESSELAGLVLEGVVGWQPRPPAIEMLFVKPMGRPWQRMFLEAGLCIWEEFEQDDAFEDFADVRRELCDLDQFRILRGRRITTVRAGWETYGAFLEVRLEPGGRVRLDVEDPTDVDSDVFVTVGLQ